jgi:hypothetical protein
MFTKFTSDQKVLWMNTFVSLVHSTLSSILVILLVCFDQVLFENRVQNIDAYSFAVVAISTGTSVRSLQAAIVSLLIL